MLLQLLKCSPVDTRIVGSDTMNCIAQAKFRADSTDFLRQVFSIMRSIQAAKCEKMGFQAPYPLIIFDIVSGYTQVP